MRSGFVQFFTGQRKRVTDRLAEYGPSSRRARGGRLKALPMFTKDSLTPDSLWDGSAEDEALKEAYLPLVDQVGGLAVDKQPGIGDAGVNWDTRSPKIAAARGRLAEKVTRVNDTTRSQIAGAVDTGLKRGYSVVQIANGVGSEGYDGILGVFDSAVHQRAETIARTETALAYNAASVAGYEEAGVEKVEVMDGEEDEACAEANGQIWTLEEAEANELEHPNCIRAFAPIAGEETFPSLEYSRWDETREDVAPAEEEALRQYQNVYYTKVNTYLRNPKLHEALDTPEELAKIRDTITKVDSAIAKQKPTKKPQLLVRGISEDDPAQLKFLTDLKPGQVYVDPAYGSASLDRATALSFARKGDTGYLLTIRAPEGSRGLDFDVLGPPEEVGKESEREVLLPRGSRYRLISRSEDEATVELLPPLPPPPVDPMADFGKASAEDFWRAIQATIKTDQGKFLTDYSVDDFRGMRTYLTANGKAGGALKSGGVRTDGSPAVEMVSLFRAPDGPKGVGMQVAKRQVAEGGNRLDCLGTGLRGKYEKQLGFRLVERRKWDDAYAPEGWNYERYGRPDVFVMEHDPAPAPTSFALTSEQTRTAARLDSRPEFLATLNRALARPDAATPEIAGAPAGATYRELVEQLDQAIEKAAPWNRGVLYQGVDPAFARRLAARGEQVQPGYIAASMEPAAAAKEAARRTVLEIDIPDLSTEVLDLANVNRSREASTRFLIARGQRLQVTGPERTEGNLRIIPTKLEAQPLPPIPGVAQEGTAAFEKAAEEGLKTDPVRSTGDLGGGIRETYRGTAGNQKVAIKIAPRDEAPERAAYLIAQRLGLPVPATVIRDREPRPAGGHGRQIVTRWAEGERGDEYGYSRELYADDVHKTALFDAIIGNTDRHPGNYLVHEDAEGNARIIPIDHGYALWKTNEHYYTAFENRDKLSAADLNALAALVEAQPEVVRELEEAGLPEESTRLMYDRIEALRVAGRMLTPSELYREVNELQAIRLRLREL